jgi:hypothetical protein
MHAQKRRFAWILGSTILMGTGAAGAIACGTDNGTTPLPGETDAGGGGKDATVADGGGGNTTDGSGGNMTDGTAGDMDGGNTVDCGKIPTLHAPGPGPFCPFQAFADGAAAFGDCDAGEHCCDYQGNTPSPAATCNAAGTACATQANYITIDFGCDTKAHCGAGEQCCMFGKDAGAGGTTNVTVNSMCPTGELLKANNVGGTHCAATCAMGEVKLCQDDTDCTAPQKCTAFPTNAQQLGVCK